VLVVFQVEKTPTEKYFLEPLVFRWIFWHQKTFLEMRLKFNSKFTLKNYNENCLCRF
jgi:hypothetical protein